MKNDKVVVTDKNVEGRKFGRKPFWKSTIQTF